MPSTIDKYERFGMAGLLLLAISMRLFTLGTADIWDDEWFTAVFYQERVTNPINQLTYILIYVSQSLLGESEFALRLPSFLLGIGGVYAIYLLGKEIRSPAIGLLSATLLTMLPWHLFHSQYARYYAAVVFFTALLHLFFLRALRRDSVPYLIASGTAVLLAISSHITAVLAPFSLWLLCAVLYFRPTPIARQFSQRFIRAGFWIGVAICIIALPFFILKLMSWTNSPWQFTRSPAQQIFQYYAEAGVLLLLAFLAFIIERDKEESFVRTYLGIAVVVPIFAVIGATFFTSMRGDYGICFVVPAIIAAAIAVNSVWHSRGHGRVLAAILVLLFLADAAPRLLSHYTDRLATNSQDAAEFLLKERRPDDRIASFSPGVRYYLREKSLVVERTGIGSPYTETHDYWRNAPLPPDKGRLWLVFIVTRDDVAPPVIEWLRRNDAKIVWRQLSPRVDFIAGGIEIFLVCPAADRDCDNNQQPSPP